MSARERDLTEGPVLPHVLALAVPAALSLLFMTVYNVTDVWFAGQVSTEAQAGLGVGTQVFFLVPGLGVGVRIGLAALVGNALGAKDEIGAQRMAWTGMAVAVGLTIFAMVAGFWGLPALLTAITDDTPYRGLAIDFVRWMLLAAPGFILAQSLAGILSGQGDNVTFAWAQGGAALLNVGLDALFVSGIPGWWDGFGLDGIAFATIGCQTAVLFWVSWHARSARALRVRVAPTVKAATTIVAQSAPITSSMLMIVIGGAATQWLLAPFSEDAIAGFGVAFRLEQMLLLPVFGICSAVLPFTSQNLGAGRPGRVRQAFWQSAAAGTALSVAGIALIWTVGPFVVGQFAASEAVASHAMDYLRVESVVLVSFVLMSLSNNLMQGLKRPGWPAILSAFRQGVGILVLGLLFTRVLDLGEFGIWLAIAVSVGAGGVMGAILALVVAHSEGVHLLGGES